MPNFTPLSPREGVLKMAKNSRLKDRVGDLRAQVEQKAEEIGEPVRRFKDFFYRTLVLQDPR